MAFVQPLALRFPQRLARISATRRTATTYKMPASIDCPPARKRIAADSALDADHANPAYLHSRLVASVSQPTFQVKLLSEDARVPTRGSTGAAGYDLYSARDETIPARGKGLVSTDISICIPKDSYARIAPRSGLAVKRFIDTGAGVVDYDYRGTVSVVLFNHSDEDFEIRKGDRIAQLILERIYTPEIQVVDELDSTERGAAGFGSTGGIASTPL